MLNNYTALFLYVIHASINLFILSITKYNIRDFSEIN